jgi:hypothetical protein
MEENLINTETQPESRSKKPVERSAQYPGRTIEESLQFVAEFYKNFRTSLTKRNDILNMIEGTHNRDIAAAAYYGFLRRDKDSYQVTELYRIISNPINQEERKAKLLEAFHAPNLNKELINRFDGDQIPDSLIAQLTRFHRITEDAAPLAADVFLKNARFCGVLDDNNVLHFQRALTGQRPIREQKLDESNEPQEEDQQKKGAITVQISTPQQGQLQHAKQEQLLLPEMTNSDKIKIRLTGGKFAYLTYPLDLNKKDIQILSKQIEQLELIVE